MLGVPRPPRGSPEGRSPFGTSLRVSLRPLGYPQGAPLRCWVCRGPKGESRGTQSRWQESEGVPQAAGYPQGAPLRCWVCRAPSRGSPEGRSPFGTSLRVSLRPLGTHKGHPYGAGCAAPPRGSPEGRSPFGRRYGGCASINHLLYSRGSPEGHRPNGGSLRVSLRTSLLSLFPLPARKGARGMVRPTPAGVWGCAACAQGGVQRGRAPLAGGMEDVPP